MTQVIPRVQVYDQNNLFQVYIVYIVCIARLGAVEEITLHYQYSGASPTTAGNATRDSIASNHVLTVNLI